MSDAPPEHAAEPPEGTASQGALRGPHDELFKAIFRSKDEAVSLLRSALPQEVSVRIDWSSLSEVPTEQIDGGLSKRYNDLLFRVNLSGAQREVFVDVALEHQSSGDRMMALRMLGLVVRRTERLLRQDPKLERLPIVLPVVLFQGEGKRLRPWRHPVRYSQLLDGDAETLRTFARYIPDFEFAIDDLTQQSWDALMGRTLTATAWVTLTLLRDAGGNPDLLQQLGNARYLEQWRQLSQAQHGAMVLEQIWVYLYRVVDAPHPQLKEFANAVGELAERTQMTTGQRLMDAARAEGEAKGKAEGKAEGKAAMLKRLIQLKFGALHDDDARRIDGGSAEELEAWTERILFASSLDELLRAHR